MGCCESKSSPGRFQSRFQSAGQIPIEGAEYDMPSYPQSEEAPAEPSRPVTLSIGPNEFLPSSGGQDGGSARRGGPGAGGTAGRGGSSAGGRGGHGGTSTGGRGGPSGSRSPLRKGIDMLSAAASRTADGGVR